MKTEGIVVLVQVALAVAFVFILAMREHVRPADYAPPRGLLEIILLISFIDKNLVEQNNKWFEVPEEVANSSRGKRWHKHKELLHQHYNKFINQGELSQDELLPQIQREHNTLVVLSSPIFIILLLIFAPLLALGWLSEVREKSKKYSIVKLVHPLERAMELMEVIGIIFTIAIWIAAITYFFRGTTRIILVALLSVTIIAALYCGLRIIWWQSEWKNFWTEKLLYVLQHAGRTNNHDLYNRAFNLYNTVNAYPAIPLTDIQRLILLLFALIQFLLAQAAPVVIEFFKR